VSRVIPFPTPVTADDNSGVVSTPVPLHDAVASARRRHRNLIAAAGAWALAHGVPLPADHVALWAQACEESGCVGSLEGRTGPWRASGLTDLMATIAAWCDLVGCALPANIAQSLWHLYGFLADTGRLHPQSDSLAELRASVVVFGPSDRFRRIPPPPPEPTAA